MTKTILLELFTTVIVCAILWIIRNAYHAEMSDAEMKTYIKTEIINTLGDNSLSVDDINIDYITKSNVYSISDSSPIVVCGTYVTNSDKNSYTDVLYVFILENDKKNFFHEVVGVNPKYHTVYYTISKNAYRHSDIIFNNYTEKEFGVDNNKKICIDYSIRYADRRENMNLIFDKCNDNWEIADSEIDGLEDKILSSISNVQIVLYGNHKFIDSNSKEHDIIATSGELFHIPNAIYGGLDLSYIIPIVTDKGYVMEPDKYAIAIMRCYENRLYYDPNWNGGEHLIVSTINDIEATI